MSGVCERHGGMNKLFHASKNIDARNNWFMALSADLFVTSAVFFFFSVRFFSLNGRCSLVWYAFEWSIRKIVFSVLDALPTENAAAHIRIGIYQTVIIFIIAHKTDALWAPTHFKCVDNGCDGSNAQAFARNERNQHVLLVFSYFDIRAFFVFFLFSSFETCLGNFALVAAEPDFAPTSLMW